jgi:hypothetical protein
MRQRWLDLKAAIRELFSPTWSHEDEPDLAADAAARTRWVESHRRPPEETP